MDAPDVHQNVEGFSTGKVLLMLLGVVIIGVTGWYLWHTQRAANATLDSATHETTVKLTR
ncbi:MAG TPA: hypothetical protein VHT70_01185 [Candidatus Saccharimonadales bacterium]|jgi:predicted negative regulator of RcsB-dependent stress response|nr:hypothetical protein [Candidatus Saccharimonadales bacterium]